MVLSYVSPATAAASLVTIPYAFIPVSAALLMYVMCSGVALLLIVYVRSRYESALTPPPLPRGGGGSNGRQQQQRQMAAWSVAASAKRESAAYWKEKADRVPELDSFSFFILVISCLIALMLYGYCAGTVQGALARYERAMYDPYQLLGLDPMVLTTSSTPEAAQKMIREAFKHLSRIHHPDQPGGNARIFAELHLAYRALTESPTDTARSNYMTYGHPAGKLHIPVFQWTPPTWMFLPNSFGMGMLLYVIYVTAVMATILMVGRTMGWFDSNNSSSDNKDAVAAKDRSMTVANSSTVSGNSSSSLDNNSNNNNGDAAAGGMGVPGGGGIGGFSQRMPMEMEYLLEVLHPNSSHMDVLYAAMTSPENRHWSIQDLARVEKMRQERRDKLKAEQEAAASKTSGSSGGKFKKTGSGNGNAVDAFADLVNGDGWDEDNDDDMENMDEAEREARERAAAAEREQEAQMERLKQATGQAVQLLEGIDEGVLGQAWVERTLAKAGDWPPTDLALLNKATFHDGSDNEPVGVMEHPGLRRVLCMTTGRLNSYMLNSHPELLEASMHKKIDQTYFKAAMEFRNRVGMLLEACLRMSMALRSYKLVSTIIETVVMFKVGCKKEHIQQYKQIMMKQNGCLPHVNVRTRILRRAVTTQSNTPPPPVNMEELENQDLYAGGLAELFLDLERTHAEAFLSKKMAAAQKQGMPPQVALQGYRETWWFMIRAQRIDTNGDAAAAADAIKEPLNRSHPMMQQVLKPDSPTWTVFDLEPPEYYLLSAWPMTVQNVAQKAGKVRVQFKVPNAVGKYRFSMAIKSSDFLGVDQELFIDAKVVDGGKNSTAPDPPAPAPALAPASTTTTTTKKAKTKPVSKKKD